MPDPFPQLREKCSSPRIETFQGMELVSLLLHTALHSVQKPPKISHLNFPAKTIFVSLIFQMFDFSHLNGHKSILTFKK